MGNSATIMQGLNMGHGAIIAANAVVIKNVDPYTVIGGNPARVIRKRLQDDTIEYLLKLAWWDWPIEKIIQNWDWLSIKSNRI